MIRLKSFRNTFPTIAADSIPDENEITILQMFVEFVGKHTSEDVAKRMSISKHKAEYHLDRLEDLDLIARCFDEYRNGHPVYRIGREGRDLLVRLKLIK